MFEKEITEHLRELYGGGMTQEEMARLTGISRPYIANILNGKQQVKNASVDLLLKVFPRATVSLTGDVRQTNAGQSGGINAQAVNGNNFFAPDVEGFRNRAIAAMIDLDLPPEALQTVLRTLKKLK